MEYLIMGSYIEGNSRIHRARPFVKLIFLIIMIGCTLYTNNWIGYIMLIGVAISAIVISGLSIGRMLFGIRKMLWFLGVIFVMNTLFFSEEDTIWSWGMINVSIKGMEQGMNIVFRVILVILFTNIFMSTTLPMEIIKAIEVLIHPLKYAGVPIKEVSMILGVSMQFIPIFIREIDIIKKAQIARGARFESNNYMDKVKSVLPLVIPIFIAAFRRADELSVAMEARGYKMGK